MFELGHCYDITKYIIEKSDKKEIIGIRGENGCLYKNGYFICHDVRDTHIYRIQDGINERYEKEPDTKIVEECSISHEKLLEFCVENCKEDLLKEKTGRDLLVAESKGVNPKEYIKLLLSVFGFEKLLKIIVELDYETGFENDDVTEFRYNTPLDTLIRRIDGGYGITEVSLDTD
ncbi:MAG: hypothetical protein UGF89_02135 [Acutalibacteraceae bacterium]|nr:hypothetical protein [Acutalibacteraceae bacterium]